MPLGTFDRTDNLARLAEGDYDVIVIGGGITGAGVALDAAARGLQCALVERDDFAAGTSSRSSKLVHGGLRYLQNGDVRLVYEALRERQRLLRNAPHLVRVLPFLVPILRGGGGVVPKKLARAVGWAMWAYDLTGGARIGKLHKRLRRDAALEHIPTLDERLAWAYLYYDARADDARLTLTLARTAALDHGATVVNHAAVRGIRKDAAGTANGVLIEADGREIEVSGRVVVNATGVWADEVRGLDEGTHPQTIRPAKGIHITVPWRRVRNDIAAVLPVRGDSRAIFVVPWAGADGRLDGDDSFTYIGTTDTDYDGDLDDPQCTDEDVAYLLRAVNDSLQVQLDERDVVGTWAGLRPLVRDASSSRTADMSRRHSVSRSGSGVITVTGGKLTTYREMAEDAVDLAVRAIGDDAPRRARRCRTTTLRLRGADGWEATRDRDPHLAERYGGETRVLEAMIDTHPELGGPLVPGLPYRRAEALYAVRYEMAQTLADVLVRRTRAAILGRDATAAHAEEVAALIGPDLGWDVAEQATQAARYRAEAERERTLPGLPETALVSQGSPGVAR